MRPHESHNSVEVKGAESSVNVLLISAFQVHIKIHMNMNRNLNPIVRPLILILCVKAPKVRLITIKKQYLTYLFPLLRNLGSRSRLMYFQDCVIFFFNVKCKVHLLLGPLMNFRCNILDFY